MGTSVIHQHDQDFRTINHHGHHAKVDPRNNIFLELMNMSRNALFAGKNVCMPHAPSVGAGIHGWHTLSPM